jgi:hypothetical protein
MSWQISLRKGTYVAGYVESSVHGPECRVYRVVVEVRPDSNPALRSVRVGLDKKARATHDSFVFYCNYFPEDGILLVEKASDLT